MAASLWELQRDVAPYTGAWIEIAQALIDGGKLKGRSLHGSVD